MREIVFAAFIVMICLVCGCSGDENPVPTQEVKQEIKVPADKLQELFLQITPATTKEELESYAASVNLFCNRDNNYTYKIAFRESDTYFGRGTTYGDSVTVRFNEDWTFKTANYYYSETGYNALMTIIGGAELNYYSYTEGSKETRTPTAIAALRDVVNK